MRATFRFSMDFFFLVFCVDFELQCLYKQFNDTMLNIRRHNVYLNLFNFVSFNRKDTISIDIENAEEKKKHST